MRGADVAQLVRQVLELVAVLGHREVTLAEGVESLPQLDGALHNVVKELGADGRPGGVGIVVWLDDGGEQVGGERVE